MAKNPKLESLREKIGALQARIQAAEAIEKEQARKDDTRLKVIVGAGLLADTTVHPETRAGLTAVLNRSIVAERDREFLKAKGWL